MLVLMIKVIILYTVLHLGHEFLVTALCAHFLILGEI